MSETHRVPQQDRSRDKLERIYRVSVELFSEGGWDAITVGNVERRSGISRGAFYLRFPNREALLQYTRQRLLDTVNGDQDIAFENARAENAQTLESAVGAAVEAIANVWHRHGPVLLRLEHAEEGDAGPDAMNHLSSQFRSVLEPVIGTDSDQRARIEFALELALSMLYLKSRPRAAFPEHGQRDWESYVRELCDAITHYLRAHVSIPGSAL